MESILQSMSELLAWVRRLLVVAFAAFLIVLAVVLEASIGVGHHILLVAGGAVLGIGAAREWS